MAGLSKWGWPIFLVFMPALFGCVAGGESKDLVHNVSLKAVAQGYGVGIMKIDGVPTKTFFEGAPESTHVAPGRHDFEWGVSVPFLTPPFGSTGYTLIRRCMWLDVVEKERYIIESKVNDRRALFRIRTESGAGVSWGNCNLTDN